MEILFGIIVLLVWLTIILEILIMGFVFVWYLLFYLLGIIYLIFSKFFSVDIKSKLNKIDDYLKKANKKLEVNLKKLDRQMILRAKKTKIYLINGIVMNMISLFLFIIFLVSVYCNDYLFSFLFLGLINSFFGIYYLKIHKRFHK